VSWSGDILIYVYIWKNGRMDVCVRVDGWMGEGVCMEWMGWMNGWIDGWMGG
jgi:hypothetical protein